MMNALICEQVIKSGAAERCFTVALSAMPPGGNSALLAVWHTLEPTLVGAVISTTVAFTLLGINRRKERRALSLELYKEYFSADFAKQRTNAETFFKHHPNEDWTQADPYDLGSPEEEREGYSAVTRFLARLSVLYQEKDLDRRFTERLLSRAVGEWWGLVYELMRDRQRMYTREAIAYLATTLAKGSRSTEFDAGYQSGLARRGQPQPVSASSPAQAT